LPCLPCHAFPPMPSPSCPCLACSCQPSHALLPVLAALEVTKAVELPLGWGKWRGEGRKGSDTEFELLNLKTLVQTPSAEHRNVPSQVEQCRFRNPPDPQMKCPPREQHRFGNPRNNGNVVGSGGRKSKPSRGQETRVG